MQIPVAEVVMVVVVDMEAVVVAVMLAEGLSVEVMLVEVMLVAVVGRQAAAAMSGAARLVVVSSAETVADILAGRWEAACMSVEGVRDSVPFRRTRAVFLIQALGTRR